MEKYIVEYQSGFGKSYTYKVVEAENEKDAISKANIPEPHSKRNIKVSKYLKRKSRIFT